MSLMIKNYHKKILYNKILFPKIQLTINLQKSAKKIFKEYRVGQL